MLSRRLTQAALVTAATISGSAALAADGFTTAHVNLRTGPGTAYAAIATLPPRAPVTIFGCLAGYGWCDIAWGRERGWASGAYLIAAAPGISAPLPAVALRVGVPVVTYDLATYHNTHYLGRPYYLVPPGVAIRRAARIQYRVNRRMERRWRRWGY